MEDWLYCQISPLVKYHQNQNLCSWVNGAQQKYMVIGRWLWDVLVSVSYICLCLIYAAHTLAFVDLSKKI